MRATGATGAAHRSRAAIAYTALTASVVFIASLATMGGAAGFLMACGGPRPAATFEHAATVEAGDKLTAAPPSTPAATSSAAPSSAVTVPVAASGSAHPFQASREMLLDSGRVYYQACAICHGGNGRGGRGPTVANSDYVQGDRTRLIRTVLDGVREPIHVNGVRWRTGEMLGWAEVWDDFRIASVLTYIRVAFNDSTVTACTPEDFETGTWASCTLVPRAAEEIAQDSVSVAEVAVLRKSATGRGE